MFDILILAGSVHLMGLISPGPDFALILRNSVIHSTKTALWSAFGIALGVLVHIAYTMTGLRVIIIDFPWILMWVGLFGVGYLAWLGIQSIRNSLVKKPNPLFHGEIKKDQRGIRPFTAIRMGFITNATNPKAIIYFVSFLSTIIASNQNVTLSVLLGIEIFALTWLWFSFVAIAISHKTIQNGLQKYRKTFDMIVGILFLCFSLSMLIFILHSSF